MTRRVAMLLLLPLLTAADAARNEIVVNDLELLKGSWKAAKGWRGGNELGKDEVVRLGLEFTDSKMVVKEGGRDMSAEFKLDPQRGHIDFEIKDVGMKFEGVYQVNGDLLRLCFTRAGRRPAGFNTKETTDAVMVELERAGK
jgi:uncharacterized protein (TIGR03067 family)